MTTQEVRVFKKFRITLNDNGPAEPRPYPVEVHASGYKIDQFGHLVVYNGFGSNPDTYAAGTWMSIVRLDKDNDPVDDSEKTALGA